MPCRRPQQRGAKLEGIYGHEVRLVGGQTVVADDAYIRNSILNPSAQVVEGFQPIMPTFKGQVTEEQLVSIVAYIKSLSGATGSSTTSANTSVAPAGSNSNTSANKPASNTQGSNAPQDGNR